MSHWWSFLCWYNYILSTTHAFLLMTSADTVDVSECRNYYSLCSFNHNVPSRHCWTGPRGPHPGWGCACADPPPASVSTVPASARCGAAAPCSGWTPSPPPSQTGGLQQTILFGEGRVQADWVVMRAVKITKDDLSPSALFLFSVFAEILMLKLLFFCVNSREFCFWTWQHPQVEAPPWAECWHGHTRCPHCCVRWSKNIEHKI